MNRRPGLPRLASAFALLLGCASSGCVTTLVVDSVGRSRHVQTYASSVEVVRVEQTTFVEVTYEDGERTRVRWKRDGTSTRSLVSGSPSEPLGPGQDGVWVDRSLPLLWIQSPGAPPEAVALQRDERVEGHPRLAILVVAPLTLLADLVTLPLQLGLLVAHSLFGGSLI